MSKEDRSNHLHTPEKNTKKLAENIFLNSLKQKGIDHKKAKEAAKKNAELAAIQGKMHDAAGPVK